MSNRWSRPKKPQSISNPNLPPNQQLQVTQTFYSGPIVHPEIAEKWEEVLPGAADRIMTQFENQSAHRQTIELRQIGWNNVKEILGQVTAFIIFMTALIGGIYLISTGLGTAGLVTVIAALVVPVALFLGGQKAAMLQLLKKRKAVEAVEASQPQNPGS